MFSASQKSKNPGIRHSKYVFRNSFRVCVFRGPKRLQYSFLMCRFNTVEDTIT